MRTKEATRAARTIIRIITAVVVTTTLALILFADFPLWGGLTVTLVVLVPCQAYLNRTKTRK